MPLQQTTGLSTTEVERALNAVLARPEYAPTRPPLLYRAMTAIGDWFEHDIWPVLSRLLPHPDWSSPAWKVVGTALIGAGALAGAALFVYLVVLAGRAWQGRHRRAAGASAGGRGPVAAAEWEALAAAAARRGDWREAAQALYQGVVRRLEERGVVRVDGAKTPGDYRREVRRGGSELLTPLEAFLGGFERVAYGRTEPEPGHYDRLRAAARLLGARG